MRRHFVPVVALALALIACAGGSRGSGGAGEAGGADCAPTEYALADGATLSGAAGRYRLLLAGVGGDGAARTVAGTLVLAPRPEGRRALPGADTPLSGTVDVDLGAVGAREVGGLSSSDPDAPGVLVIERAMGGRPDILLRFGAEANRERPVAFDRAYMALTVHVVDGSGFGGAWRSGSEGVATSGHFCAWRIEG